MIVTKLLKAGAVNGPRDALERTAWDLALQWGHPALIKAMAKPDGVPPSGFAMVPVEPGAPDDCPQASLVALLTAGRAAALEHRLASMGVAVDQIFCRGLGLLHLSRNAPDPGVMLKALRHLGLPVDHLGIEGTTPLAYAAGLGDDAQVQRLLQLGADPNYPTAMGSALHGAVAEHSTKTVQLLLTHGADPNATTFHGDTPLHVAAIAGFADMVALLLRAGADAAKANASGKRPVDLANDHQHHEVALALTHGVRVP